MKKTINIQNEANIHVEGTHIHHNSKPIICIETGEVFASITDVAEKVGCGFSNVSSHLRGKSRSVKGKHYCYMSRSVESLDAIVTRLRETSTMEEDARKWREYQAEQEAIRKAEEKRIADERRAKEEYEAKVEKAKAKIERIKNMRQRLEQQQIEAEKRLIEAEREYEELIGCDESEVA